MFSTMHNQRKAQELIAEAVDLIESVDERFARAREALNERAKRLDAVRSHLIQKSLARFRERLETIENEPAQEIAPVAEESVAWQLQSLYERAEIAPVDIKEVRKGKARAFFGALTAAVLTVVVALVVAAVATGKPLNLQTFTDLSKLDPLLTWIGGGAIPGRLGNPLLGVAGLALGAVVAWLITWSVMMGKTARRNLATARQVYEEAQSYHDKKIRYAEAAEELERKLATLEKNLETCDIYLQEYNAVLRRILHTEGHDFESFKVHSKEAVERAMACARALVPMLNTAIVTTEGTPAKQLDEAIEWGERVVAALTEERPLPDPETRFAPKQETEETENEVIILGPPKNKEEKEREEEKSSEPLSIDSVMNNTNPK